MATELPYQVAKADLLATIAEQIGARRLDGIADLRDESDRDGVRVVFELKRDATPAVVLNNLFKTTRLQTPSRATRSRSAPTPTGARRPRGLRAALVSGSASARVRRAARRGNCARPRRAITSSRGCSRRRATSTRSSPPCARRRCGSAAALTLAVEAEGRALRRAG